MGNEHLSKCIAIDQMERGDQRRSPPRQAAISGTVVSTYRLRRRKAVRVVTDIDRGTTCVMAQEETEDGKEGGAP